MTDWCDKIQQLGKGISSPSRYKILDLLISGPKTVGELVDHVGLTQPAVSQHLRTLKACNLVKSSKDGQEVVYSLNTRYVLSVLEKYSSGVSKCKEA